MTLDQALLLCLLWLPLAAALVVGVLGPSRGTLVRGISLTVALIELALALVLAVRFMSLEHQANLHVLPTFTPEFVPGSTPGSPHDTTWELFPTGTSAVKFYIGLDGLNVWLVVLIPVLLLPSVLVSWTHVSERVNEFYAWLLALQTALLGVFLSFDILLFYMFFEASLVPLFFLIGIWGGSQRRYAAGKFFIYTLAGSLITLLGVLGIVLAVQSRTGELTFSIPHLVELVHRQLALGKEAEFWDQVQKWTFFALATGFAVKVPLVPFHTWLPLAHVEAPTAGSVDLAGILLKIGVYGFLRLCLPLAPDASLAVGFPALLVLAVIGIIYGAFCAYSQDDAKKLVAYSSVSHMGLIMVGMLSMTAVGLAGSLFQMINHGLSTGALFLMIGMIYERYHTRDLRQYSGMATVMPLFAVLLVFFCLSSAGLPGLNGFVGEILCLFGIAQYEWEAHHSFGVTMLAATGVVLGAWYLFTMLRRLLFGHLKEPEGKKHDLLPREWLLLSPLVVLCVFMGVYPRPILKAAQPDVDMVAHIADLARNRAGIPTATTQPPTAAAATVAPE